MQSLSLMWPQSDQRIWVRKALLQLQGHYSSYCPAPEQKVSQRQVRIPDRIHLRLEMKPRWTSRLSVCLVCGLASQLPSLIAYKRKSFEFKESNHCSCFEATIWKAFVDSLLKDSPVPFHTSLSHCVTFSVLSFFFFFFLNPSSTCLSKITSIVVHHLARLVLPETKLGLWKMLCILYSCFSTSVSLCVVSSTS